MHRMLYWVHIVNSWDGRGGLSVLMMGSTPASNLSLMVELERIFFFFRKASNPDLVSLQS